MPNLQNILIEHHRCVQSALAPARPNIASPATGSVSQLWSEAKVRPLYKVQFTSVGGNGNISYHIPAASSIEIEFSTRAAVSSAIKVHLASPAQLSPAFIAPHCSRAC